MKPDSPEYQEAYQKEMQRLEAEAGKTTEVVVDKPAATTSEKIEEKPVDDPVKELTAKVEKLDKALKDTQRWGHTNAAEVARLKKAAEDRERTETRPALLDANPGLEDAIKHVAGREKPKEAPEEWLSTVARALPDVETLLSDQEFHAKAAARRAELGPAWDDPINAIRELSSIRTEHLSQKNATAAVEAARKDFEKKAGKRTAMSVPGGSGGKDAPPDQDDAVKRYQTMSTVDFEKERQRVMGF